jgi:hypothetical protein
MFTPDDDTAPDGHAHAEAARNTPGTGLACLCGFTGDSIADLDQHFIRVFTPADKVGRDGGRHAHAITGGLPA